MPAPRSQAGGATATGDRYGYFKEEDAYKTWRIIAHNINLTGMTEGFGFSNGQAVVPALPKTAKHYSDCGREGELCRLHERLLRLNNLMNYPGYAPGKDARTGRSKAVRFEGYRILSEEAYEREFGEEVEPEELEIVDL